MATKKPYLNGFNKQAKILIIGLDNAGKSTLLNLIKDNRLVQFPPTDQPRSESLTLGGVSFQAYDLGGHVNARRLWRDYFPAVNGVVFIVDAAERERFEEARTEITGVLTDENISDVPVAILGNKTDRVECVGVEELIKSLDLSIHLSHNTTQSTMLNNTDEESCRPCRLFMTSMLKRQGYGDAFRWLASSIK